VSAEFDPRSATHESQKKVRERLLRDPAVRTRIEEGLERLRRGETVGPGMTREQLEGFLRDDA
jgi:hypothetical protein